MEFAGKLGSQGLVVADDQSGSLHPRNDIGHSEGLAAAGNPQQGLVLEAFIQALLQPVYRLGLVTGHLKV
ncbi:hypothetical protein ES703_84139 [subsurface metagenome]